MLFFPLPHVPSPTPAFDDSEIEGVLVIVGNGVIVVDVVKEDYAVDFSDDKRLRTLKMSDADADTVVIQTQTQMPLPTPLLILTPRLMPSPMPSPTLKTLPTELVT